MNLFKAISPSNPRFQKIEFSLLLGWALLYPAKIGYSYYLGFMCLLALFTLAKVSTLKNVALDRFSLFLFAFNAVFIFSAFFSPHPLKSLLFVADFFLVSLWFMFFYLEKEDMEQYLRLAAYVISLSSLTVIVAFALQGGRLPVTAIFNNPILQGIVSALAFLVFLHALLRKYGHAGAALLALNFAAVVVSASKAAALGLAFFAAIMIFRGRRRWLVYFVAILLLLVLAPNPLRRMVGHSLRHDPYVFDRLDIWNMSARIYRHYPWTGVGPDLFNEAARRFNFAQDKGASRYGKIPESPHSDYWKVITENGLPGLVFILAFLFFAVRRLLSPPWFSLSKVLLAFLLAQMLLFNFVFNCFFLIIFFLLLRDLLYGGRRFVSLQPRGRVLFAATLIVPLLLLYCFPYLADHFLGQAETENDFVRRFSLLERAALCSPLDERVPLAKGAMLRAFNRFRSDLAAWSDALDNARLAQRLDKNGMDAFILEADLFWDVLACGNRYSALGEEILGPLRRAEKNDPFSPFIKMRQAVVLREFGRSAEARSRAQAALDLEPDYASAIVFIHELDGLPAADPALRERLARIRAKAAQLKARPGSYLFKLHQLPPGASGL